MAAEQGVTAPVRFISKAFPDRLLKESSVRTWKSNEVELAKNKKADEEMVVKKLVDKKRGRLVFFGSELDKCASQFEIIRMTQARFIVLAFIL